MERFPAKRPEDQDRGTNSHPRCLVSRKFSLEMECLWEKACQKISSLPIAKMLLNLTPPALAVVAAMAARAKVAVSSCVRFFSSLLRAQGGINFRIPHLSSVRSLRPFQLDRSNQGASPLFRDRVRVLGSCSGASYYTHHIRIWYHKSVQCKYYVLGANLDPCGNTAQAVKFLFQMTNAARPRFIRGLRDV